ncbi:hypothetical protein Q4610_01535 [Sphingobium sp. HBC34]|uniref:Uncharacterized protein n=1 Tax=Sphingobium cyanobacteriorum TaxID=3063954 RepID=A0ABT8ZH26_9SPHN|nr:hypothetical protein [Sphingobium sp. HBC34]MDO7833716.1 hypothetical protein [Sphingobium sp. HBC34]
MKDRALIEKLARHLARGAPDAWPERVEDAASILALMKEPDGAMRAAGDTATWGAMIDAALRERWSLPRPSGTEAAADGADEEGEIRLPREAVGHDRADWVHLHHGQEKPA